MTTHSWPTSCLRPAAASLAVELGAGGIRPHQGVAQRASLHSVAVNGRVPRRYVARAARERLGRIGAVAVHPHTAAFDLGADDYERGRPGYPPALVAWFRARYSLRSRDVVVDLGAGTGKLTRLLAQSPARVVAVEPLREMRRVLTAALPGVEVVDATAEAMPFPDRTVRLVACGQSFRWFATEEALTEIARVLVPGGALVVVANRDAGTGPLGERFEATLGLAGVETAEAKPGADWRTVLGVSRRFAVVEEAEFDNPFFVDRDGLVARLRSSSQFSRLPADRQAELITRFDTEVERWPLDLSQVTSVTALAKSARA